MGKAAKWFRCLFGLKKPDPQSPPTRSDAKPPKRRWSKVVRSCREKDLRTGTNGDERATALYGTASATSCSTTTAVDPNKHAIAVAAATAAVAEAAVAAAQAAAAVVKLTSSSGRSCATAPAHVSTTAPREEWVWASVKIQAAFRAYLARRALRALKALVKLQALVRGHIIRKQTADILRGIQALLRAQARARAGRAQYSESPLSSHKSSQLQCPDPATPEKFEQAIRVKSTKHGKSSSTLKRSGSKDKTHLASNWSGGQMDERNVQGTWINIGSVEGRTSDDILEIDAAKSLFTPKCRNLFQSPHNAVSSDQHSHSFTTSKDSATHQTAPSPSSCEVQSLTPLKLSHEVEESSFCSANCSPQFFSASSKAGSLRRGPFTPTKSDSSRSHLSGYSDYPNYMACTESSKAKLRSHSAPKQRPHYERSSSSKRNSIQGFGDAKLNAQRGSSALHANFTSKAYPGSGRLDRFGMPVVYDHGSFANRY